MYRRFHVVVLWPVQRSGPIPRTLQLYRVLVARCADDGARVRREATPWQRARPLPLSCPERFVWGKFPQTLEWYEETMKCRPCAGARRRAMAARRRQVSRPTAAAAHGAKALRRGVFPINPFIQIHTRRIVRPASPAEAARAGWPRERGATRQTGERNGVSGRSVRHATRGQTRGEGRAVVVLGFLLSKLVWGCEQLQWSVS